MRYPSTGILRFSIEPTVGHKLSVEVDPGIADVYRALVPKAVRLQRTRFAPHISVIRKEPVPNEWLWGRGHGELVAFEYEPMVYNDETYWWLRVFSEELKALRQSLGLPPLSELARPPDLFDSFHLTIGNTKFT